MSSWPYQVLSSWGISFMGSSLPFYPEPQQPGRDVASIPCLQCRYLWKSQSTPYWPFKILKWHIEWPRNRFTANKVFSLVQANLKLHAGSSNTLRDSPRNPSLSASFWAPHYQTDKFRRCFICGDHSRDHTSHNCMATCNINGSPCHLFKQGPSDKW